MVRLPLLLIDNSTPSSRINCKVENVSVIELYISFEAALFAWAIASLKEQSLLQTPSFVSAIFVTVNVAACVF